MKLLVVRNKRSIIHLTNKATIKEVGESIGLEIIEMTNIEVWQRLRNDTLDKDIKKVWLIVKDYQLARYLEIKGYQVFNNSKAIEICDNKGLQYIYI